MFSITLSEDHTEQIISLTSSYRRVSNHETIIRTMDGRQPDILRDVSLQVLSWCENVKYDMGDSINFNFTESWRLSTIACSWDMVSIIC